MQHDTAIVGAGLGGLACALHLEAQGRRVLVLEAADRPGGRVGSVAHPSGFRLDLGFQVYLEAYPEGAEVLDLEALDLRPFYRGARVFTGAGLAHLADPWRHPIAALRGLSLIRPLDLLGLGRVYRELRGPGPLPPLSAGDYLRERGLSERVRERFFGPFFGGVGFDGRLEGSLEELAFRFRMFAAGAAAVPAAGMQAIPDQLAARLRPESLRFGSEVVALEEGALRLASGERIEAGAIVLGTPLHVTRRLLGEETPSDAWRSTLCHWFAAPTPPYRAPVLVLDGTGRGPINHLAVLSNLSESYAPAGRALICANTVDLAHDDLDAARAQLRDWFGAQVDAWQHLETQRIPAALPRRPPGALPDALEVRSGLYRCGDQAGDPSINGALESGRRCAERILAAGLS